MRLSRFLATLSAVLAAAPAPGATPDNYQHTAWTITDGVPARIRSMAQTQDGWLWLGTADGLFRFDGMRFERFPLPPREGIIRDRIEAIAAAPNGDLYISYYGEGASVLHSDGRFENLPAQSGQVGAMGAMVRDVDGSLWVISGSVQHLHGGRWDVVAEGMEWRKSEGVSMLLDGLGQLWAANDTGVWRLDRARGRFVQVARQGGELLLAPDGHLWLFAADRAPLALGATGAQRPSAYAQGGSRWVALFDGEGGLWRLNCPQTVCYAPHAVHSAEAPVQPTGLSGSEAHAVLEDREGDIWVATESGLDRFRRKRILPSRLPGSGVRYSLAKDGAGGMWAADFNTGTLWRLPPDAPPVAQVGRPVTLVANGRDGALLVGDARGIERRSAGAVERIALPPGPDGKPRDHHLLGILDDGKVLWTASMETGLLGWHDGRWWPRSAFTLPAKIYQSAPGGPGQLWLATGDGELVLYDNGRLTRFDMRGAGLAAAIFAGAPLTVGGSTGLAVLANGKLRLLRGADPDALRNVSGMVATPAGDRWLNGAAGLVHVRAADWRASMADPDLPLRYELFGPSEGYPGEAALDSRWPSAMSADGRNLWLAATGGLVRIDTGSLRRNSVAPQPVVLRITAGRQAYRAGSLVTLAPGSSDFRVEFTAPALHMPERVRFTYRLEGFEQGWHDAGPRRATSYTNVGPGDYVLRVRAANEDGIVSAVDATQRLRIAPTLFQTVWFKLACGCVLSLLATLLYRYRVHYVTARLAERLQVRTAERERIARTLHDTFLQTVHGLILRIDAIATRQPQDDPARRQLEQVLADAGQAIGEGRDQLQQLRAGDAHVLEDVVVEAVARLRMMHGPLDVDLHIEGEPRMLSAVVSEDLAEIVREALRNAFAHAGASKVVVTIVYGWRKLLVRIADDGCGIDRDVLRDGGRSGHWGLVGMRERAVRLRARFDIESGAHGTTVSVALRAVCAYAAAG